MDLFMKLILISVVPVPLSEYGWERLILFLTDGSYFLGEDVD
jgi:hypothetical protein